MQLEKAIQFIMSSHILATIQDKYGNSIIVSFSIPSIEDRIYMDFLYEQEFNKAIIYKIPTEKQIIEEAKKNGIWTTYEDSYINNYDNIIKYSKQRMQEAVSTIERKNIEKQIKQSEINRKKIQEKYNELLNRSAESIAREAQVVYLISKITRTSNGNLLWEHINECKDQVLIWNAIKIYHEMNSKIDIKLIRQIARSPQWRLRWNISKKNILSLFGRHIKDLSDIQTSLIYWSQIYDSAFESLESPSDEILNDDDQFDKWLEEQAAKRKSEKVNRNMDKKRSDGFYDNQGKFHARSSNVTDHHEYGECVSGYYDKQGYYREYTIEEKRERIAAIYGRNSIVTRRILASEVNKIEQKGILRDQDLRNENVLKILGCPMTKGK